MCLTQLRHLRKLLTRRLIALPEFEARCAVWKDPREWGTKRITAAETAQVEEESKGAWAKFRAQADAGELAFLAQLRDRGLIAPIEHKPSAHPMKEKSFLVTRTKTVTMVQRIAVIKPAETITSRPPPAVMAT